MLAPMSPKDRDRLPADRPWTALSLFASTLLMAAACSSAGIDDIAAPSAGMCFDFEGLAEGQLPAGFLLEAAIAKAGSAAGEDVRVAPGRGHAGGRGMQVRTPAHSGSVLWLTGARFEAATYSLRFRPLEARTRVGFVFAARELQAGSTALPVLRTLVSVEFGQGDAAVLELSNRGARELERCALPESSRAWRRLHVQHVADLLRIGIDRKALLDAPAPRSNAAGGQALVVGLYVRGACVFDDFWVY